MSFNIEAVVEEDLAGMDLDNDGIVEYHELKAYQSRKVHPLDLARPCVFLTMLLRVSCCS